MRTAAFINMCKEDPEFCKGNLGIPRGKMPQVKAKSLEKLLEIAKERGVKISRGMTYASKLKPVQNEINLEMAETVLNNVLSNKFDLNKDPLLLSKGNYILNGHHRWAGALLGEKQGERIPLKYIKIDLPVYELLDIISRMEGVKYTEFNAMNVQKHKVASAFHLVSNIQFEGNNADRVALDVYAGSSPVGKIAAAEFCKLDYNVCNGNLGISRINMPQILEDEIDEFLEYLEEKGVQSRRQMVPVDRLNATQKEINADKAENICKSILRGRFNPEPSLIVSSDGYILDGHHRWAGGLLAKVRDGLDVVMNVIRVNIPINNLLKEAHNYDNSVYAGFND